MYPIANHQGQPAQNNGNYVFSNSDKPYAQSSVDFQSANSHLLSQHLIKFANLRSAEGQVGNTYSVYIAACSILVCIISSKHL